MTNFIEMDKRSVPPKRRRPHEELNGSFSLHLERKILHHDHHHLRKSGIHLLCTLALNLDATGTFRADGGQEGESLGQRDRRTLTGEYNGNSKKSWVSLLSYHHGLPEKSE